MKWGYPDALLWLWLLVPLIALVVFLSKRRLRRMQLLLDGKIIAHLVQGWRPERLRTKNIVWLLAIALIFIALARPQWGFHWEEVKRRGLDIMVALDTSKSMLAEDIKPNRLQQAKWGIRDLVQQLKGDRVGLVAFAGGSFLQCPLTIDYAAFLLTVDDLYCGIIPRGGTAIGQALQTAMNGFEQQTEADRVIILITDGEDNEGGPLKLVDQLKAKNIRVFTIGVGSPDGELIPITDADGHTGFLKDQSDNVVKSSLKEDVLEKLALATGGAYIRSTPGDTGLEQIVKESLSKLKRDESESRMMKAYEDRFVWFLGLAFCLLVAEASLREFRRSNEEKKHDA